MSLTKSVLITCIQASRRGGVVVGQAEFVTAGTVNWTVPEGVFSVSVVAVGGGQGTGSTTTSAGTSAFNNSLYAFDSNGRNGGGHAGADGGGNGGLAGPRGAKYVDPNGVYNDWYYEGGGGGAAGYSGNGGNASGGSGTGGGGAAGYNALSATAGGGVGIYGEGPSGTTPSAPGSGGTGQKYGGGNRKYNGAGTGGGGLGYKNNIAVTPGQVIPIKVGAGGAVRVIWPGNLRQFPTTRTANE